MCTFKLNSNFWVHLMLMIKYWPQINTSEFVVYKIKYKCVICEVSQHGTCSNFNEYLYHDLPHVDTFNLNLCSEFN